MPFEQLAVGWLLERCGDAAPDISLVSKGVRLVEVMVQLEISKGLGVVDLSGKRIGDVSQVPGEVAHVLVLVPGLLPGRPRGEVPGLGPFPRGPPPNRACEISPHTALR